MRARGSAQAGFTYLGILAAIILMGLLLTAAARVWTLTEQRERETQLLFVGDSIRMAISAYYAHGHRYPLALQDLLEDKRSPVPVRYLRRLYLDPMTNSADWKLVLAPEGGIKGVYSGSGITPIKRANFPIIDASFADTDCYCAWQFVYEPRFRRRVAPGTGAPGTSAPGTSAPGNLNGQ
jgi:type II secretory pathway pseudopilin PulG